MAQARPGVTPLPACRPFPPALLTSAPVPSGWAGKLFTGALVAGLAVAGPLPGRPQVRGASGAESVVGTQALDLPRLRASLAGARTLGRPQPSHEISPAPRAAAQATPSLSAG